MRNLESYRNIVGDDVISDIYRKVRKLYRKHILHINSTYQGGGVAEILASLVPLMNNAGIDAGWRILHGNPDFFTITKKFHNALQGQSINLSELKKRLYIQASENFSIYTHINHDCVIIHDPQPLPFITFYKKRQPWIWRCHIDLTNPDAELWEFLKQFILRYDVVILSSKKYQRDDLPVDQRVIYPAIDPLSYKNSPLPEETVKKYLNKFNVPLDKPIICQISRFDKWKDPEGVLEVFKLVKEEVDCRLVLCGSMALDDPEGCMIYDQVSQKARPFVEKGEVILITSENNILVNALQRTASVVIQKSIREGFGLTVTESLWKERALVASRVGGITHQVIDGENGFLLDPYDIEGFARKVIELLKDREMAKELGRNGKELVRKKFMITRLLSDYLDLLREIL